MKFIRRPMRAARQRQTSMDLPTRQGLLSLRNQHGFSLLEVVLAVGLLGILSYYLLDLYQVARDGSRLEQTRQRMTTVVAGLENYFLGQQSLPAAADDFDDPGDPPTSLPVDQLDLAPQFRFDRYGRPFYYRPAPLPDRLTVDGVIAGGVLISHGPNQRPDYTVVDEAFTSSGDDLLIPVNIDTRAAEVVLEELGELMKRVEAYDRVFAGVQNNPATDWDAITGLDREVYGDVATWGAPPVIDPDYYDQHFVLYPQLYPTFPIPGYPLVPAGSVPTWEELIMFDPDDWPGTGAYGGNFLNNWPPTFADLYGDLALTSVADPVSDSYWDPRLPDADHPAEPNQGDEAPFDPAEGYFGAYSYPVASPDPPSAPVLPGYTPESFALFSYALIDEDGCVSALGGTGGVGCLPLTELSNDPNCGRATISSCPPGDELDALLELYGLGDQYRTDPWGNEYRWGRAQPPGDRRYHVFYSMGPDGIANTDDDITLY